ncbi:hypothetical protein D3C75_775330 [compost metagenome]
MRQMPGNGFPFAVRVSRQIDFFHFFTGILKFLENRSLTANRNIFGAEVILYFDANLALRQISDMSHRSLYDIFTA